MVGHLSVLTGRTSGREVQSSILRLQGSETFRLLCSFCAPAKPEECTYKELHKNWMLILALDVRFLLNVFVLSHVQSQTESLTRYVTELRGLTSTCN